MSTQPTDSIDRVIATADLFHSVDRLIEELTRVKEKRDALKRNYLLYKLEDSEFRLKRIDG